MEPESESGGVKALANEHFRLGVLPPNEGHAFASLGGGERVDHVVNCEGRW